MGVSGSLGYGTSDEQSDIDLRGVTLNRKSELIGFDRYEQYEDQETDSVIYTFNKAIKLFLECNPNAIELLGLNPEHYLFLHPIGKDLIARSQMFLSKRAINSFSKYASSQLKRLQNALARNLPSLEQGEIRVMDQVQTLLESLMEKHEVPEGQGIKFYWNEEIVPMGDKQPVIEKQQMLNKQPMIDKQQMLNKQPMFDKQQMSSKQPMIDIRLEHFPLKACNHIISESANIVKSYQKLKNKKYKKSERSLNKHAMHLIRLFMMAIDILEKGQINTYRGEERELLLKIKKGEFQDEMGNFKSDFFELVSDYEVRVQRAATNTILPDHPDMKLVEDYVMHINKKVINDEF